MAMPPSISDVSISCSKSLNNGDAGTTPTPCRPFLKPKFQIGSVKGPKNFGSNQTVFHRDDVPVASRERKKAVQEWKERRILAGGKPPGWCSSVSLDGSRLKEARTRSNSELDPGKPYQYSYRAERLPPKSPDPVPRPNRFKVSEIPPGEIERRRVQRASYPDNALEHPKRAAEIPVNPCLDHKLTWDSSTQPDVRERRRRLEENEVACQLASQKRSAQLKPYTSPEQRDNERRVRIRQLKNQGAIWKSWQTEPHPLQPTYNRLAKYPIYRMRMHRHSGKWEHSDAEGCYMWSDTASFVFDSPGDIVRVHNPTGFNFASPCLTHG